MWVLLDKQSTVHVFSKRRLLKNIRKSDKALKIFYTVVWMTISLQGHFPGYATVWFHPGGIANILYLLKVVEK